jgi:beta-glucosidase
MDFQWTLNSPGRGIPFDWYSVRWTGTITAPASGVTRLGVEGNDGYRLYLDDKLIVDDWQKRSYTATLATVSLAAGSTHQIRIEYFESAGNARVKLVWDAGAEDYWRQNVAAAVQTAGSDHIAIVVVGLEEGEFRDRAFLRLPARTGGCAIRKAYSACRSASVALAKWR